MIVDILLACGTILAAGGAIYSHINSRRARSGTVDTSEASQLWDTLSSELTAVRKEVQDVKDENRQLGREILQLREENIQLRQENLALKLKIDRLTARNCPNCGSSME